MALSNDAPLTIGVGDSIAIPAAAALIYEGSAIGLNASGYGRALVAGDRFLGHTRARCSNAAGSAGDLNINVLAGIYFLEVTITSVAVTDVGKKVYMSDDATYTLTAGSNSFVGYVARYVTTNTADVKFTPASLQEVYDGIEFACITADLTHDLLPAAANQHGLLIVGAYGIVSEVFAGGTEDQGVVTVYDEDDNSICTLTPTDAGADAIGDVIVGYDLTAASTGDAAKTVAAGKSIYGKVTQAASGTSLAGKMKVHLITKPLA